MGRPTLIQPCSSPYNQESVNDAHCLPAGSCLPSASRLSPPHLQQVITTPSREPSLHPDSSILETLPVTQTPHEEERKNHHPGCGRYVGSWRNKSHFGRTAPSGEKWRRGNTHSIYRISCIFYAKFSRCLLMPAFPLPFNLCFHFILGGL